MGVLTLGIALDTPAQSLVTPSPPTQNLFEADFGSGNINEFTPSGAQSTFVSGVSFNAFAPLAFNGEGDLFVGANDSIIEITPGGSQSTFASLGFDSFALTFNNTGDLFAVEGNSIVEITPEGVQSTYATGIPGGINYLAFDSAGNLFVTTEVQPRIYEVALDGTVGTFVTGEPGTRGAMAFDSEGDLFIARGNDIYEYMNSNGTLNSTPVLFSSSLDNATELVFDSAGDLFESDNGTGDINEFINDDGTLSSTPVVFASGLDEPYGLAFAPVPEPSSLALLAIGTAALLIRRRKN
jgi:hypothetical protein